MIPLIHLPRLSAALALVGCADNLGLNDLEYDQSSGGGLSGVGAAAGVGSEAGSSTGGAGATGSGNPFSDEFNDTRTLASWTVNHEAQMGPPLHTLLDIDATVPGQLAVEPNLGAFWQDASAGPFIYKTWTGNFLVTARVSAVDRNDGSSPPDATWSGAGLMVRDGASNAEDENWVLITNGLLGNASTTGTSYWSTQNSSTDFIATRGAPHFARLAMCRFDGEIRLYQRTDSETEWNWLSTVYEGSTAPDLPETVQLGIAAHLTDASSRNLRAEVDFIRLIVPSSAARCLPTN